MGSWGREEMQQGGILRTAAGEGWLVDWAVPHLHVNKPGGTTRERDRPHNPGFQHWEIKPQNP